MKKQRARSKGQGRDCGIAGVPGCGSAEEQEREYGLAGESPALPLSLEERAAWVALMEESVTRMDAALALMKAAAIFLARETDRKRTMCATADWHAEHMPGECREMLVFASRLPPRAICEGALLDVEARQESEPGVERATKKGGAV